MDAGEAVGDTVGVSLYAQKKKIHQGALMESMQRRRNWMGLKGLPTSRCARAGALYDQTPLLWRNCTTICQNPPTLHCMDARMGVKQLRYLLY